MGDKQRMRFTQIAAFCLLATLAAAAPPGKRDYRQEPFRVAVALGDSITAGGTATRPELCWVSLLRDLLNESQLEPVQMYNHGIGGNVISPRSSHYDDSGKPSAMERYDRHVIALKPDLVLISYGVNDARGGTPLHLFVADVRHMVQDIKEQTGAVIVIVNAHFMTDFVRYKIFDQGSIPTLMGYNEALRRLAAECDVLYVDVFAAEGMTPWLIDEDGVHPNNLGHRIIANRIFEVLAQNCSALSGTALERRKSFKAWRDESELTRRPQRDTTRHK
jgi:acyl-CoA thioesterase I